MNQIEVVEIDGAWVAVFDYHPAAVAAIKNIGGAKFVPKDKGGPHWKLPATLDTYDRLKEIPEVEMAPEIWNAAAAWRMRAARLRAMAEADSAPLEMLPELNPPLYDFVKARGYQLADIRFMAEADHPMNFNQPGTGKTVETLGAIYEAGLDLGPTLVIAPLTALQPTWGASIARWLPTYRVGLASAPAGHTGRVDPFHVAVAAAQAGENAFICVNPEAIKHRKDGSCKYPALYTVDWNVIVIDEFHRMGLNNPKTLFYKSIRKLKAEKKILLSGTPMGGRPIKLWSALNFLYPQRFHSKWEFATNWLSIYDNGFGQEIGDVKKHRRDEFNHMMSEYMVRRIKTDIMKWLPPKQYIEQWVEMTPAQAKQYREWEANTEIEIDEEQLSAISILAVYTRLRQFAGAVQTVTFRPDETIQLLPTPDSPKLPALEEILAERGILDGEGDAKVVIFSQFTTMVDMVNEWLTAKGVEVGVITGKVKVQDRDVLVDRFQDDPTLRVMLMNTQAGGVSITLDAADTVVFLDETWNPDDQEQAEDRVHRGTKESQVMVYKILTSDTIEEQIYRKNISKETINDRVLNFRQTK